MKILWFTNTPANASEFFKKKNFGGGWLSSLDKELQTIDYVNLNVAFYYPEKRDEFSYLKTKYYPIYGKSKTYGKIRKFISRFSGQLESEDDIQLFLKVIKKVKPDIIHIHGTENPFGYVNSKTDVPVVISIQGYLTVYHHKFFSGIHEKFKFYGQIKDRLLGKGYLNVYKHFKNMMLREQNILKYSKYIIGRTEWDKRITRVVAPQAVYFHGDELLREVFYEKKWHNSTYDPIILHTTIGNSLYKGLETILQSAKILKNNFKMNIIWNVAGVGEKDAIVKIAEQYSGVNSNEQNIHYLGKISSEILADILIKSTIYVHPSHIENSPNSICEAMILGMPIVATFAGGTPSLLSDGEEGILVQDGDPYAMAGTILEIVEDREKGILLGENARKRALKRHDKNKVIKDLLNIYTEILNLNKTTYEHKK